MLITRMNAGVQEKLALLAEVGKMDYLTQNWWYNPVAQRWNAPGRAVCVELTTSEAKLLARGIDMPTALLIVG